MPLSNPFPPRAQSTATGTHPDLEAMYRAFTGRDLGAVQGSGSPEWSQLPGLSYDEGTGTQSFDLAPFVTGETEIVATSALPAGVTLAAGVVQTDTATAAPGVYSFTVLAQNDVGASAPATVYLTVRAAVANQPPVWGALPTITGAPGAGFTGLDLEPYVSDPDGSIDRVELVGTPAHIALDGYDLTIAHPAEGYAERTATLRAYDDSGAFTDTTFRYATPAPAQTISVDLDPGDLPGSVAGQSSPLLDPFPQKGVQIDVVLTARPSADALLYYGFAGNNDYGRAFLEDNGRIRAEHREGGADTTPLSTEQGEIPAGGGTFRIVLVDGGASTDTAQFFFNGASLGAPVPFAYPGLHWGLFFSGGDVVESITITPTA
jgi:hypothetical protein